MLDSSSLVDEEPVGELVIGEENCSGCEKLQKREDNLVKLLSEVRSMSTFILFNMHLNNKRLQQDTVARMFVCICACDVSMCVCTVGMCVYAL